MEHLKDKEMAEKIAQEAALLGGSAYYVGGYVRDLVQGKPNKDIDIEVHGIRPAQLEQILDGLGHRMEIGESFGIYGLRGFSLDIAMPRKETNRGAGHKDFDICVDPFIGTYKAARRRDFTFNALMQNVLTGEIVDHFGGVEDLKAGVVRHVDDASFAEDPLRVLRAAQFAARFGFRVAPETVSLCARMDLKALPRERILGEVEKALLRAEKPSVFFEVLRQMGQLEVWFPELEQLIGVPQSPEHHAEGDVWVHTMMVLDQAAGLANRSRYPLGFLLAALTHDFGKAVCTQVVDGKIHAYGHEEAGLPLIEAFLERLTNERRLIRYVLNLARDHMKPNIAANDHSSVKATNRMFDRSVDPEGLVALAIADGLGKIPAAKPGENEDFFRERLDIFRELMARPYVMGRDLIDAGLEPSEGFTQYLELAHKLRLAGVPKDSALRQVLALTRKKECPDS